MLQQCTVDVIGVVLELGSTSTLTMKDGRQTEKRTLTIGDEGNVSIAITLWGAACEAHPYDEG